uniref:Type-4 uracil-DNA glycosylase n=1 Tax=Fervidicoccus fontis TaxID=683846 RepID=A0A7J3ZIY7_9CREN
MRPDGSGEAQQKLNLLREIVRDCKKCQLYKQRRNPVLGEGPSRASLMLVGEAPGRTEDLTGRPFVGHAGRLLTRTLESLGVRRAAVYITNVVKCRPPKNRPPLHGEVLACLPYLVEQIRVVQPEVVLTLGLIPSLYVINLESTLKTGSKPPARYITELRGRLYACNVGGLNVKIVPTFHPAAVLRNPKCRSLFESDIKTAIEISGLRS